MCEIEPDKLVTKGSILALAWRCKVIGFVEGRTTVSSLLFDGVKLREDLT